MIDDEEPPATSKPAFPPVLVWAGVMVALTFGAAAAGTGLGLLIGGTPNKDSPGTAKAPGVISEMKYGGETSLRELPPIIANLAEPSDAWVRVQASIVFDGKAVPKPDLVAAEIGEDILGFMRTLSDGANWRRQRFAAFAGRSERTRGHSLRRTGARAHHSNLGGSMKKSFLVLALTLALVMISATAASAQVPDLNSLIPQGNGTVASRIIQIVALLTVLSVAPGLLVMVTSFTRFAVALSFLRSGLGLQSTPANLILISLSLFMTFYVMAPTFERAWDDGVKPLMDNSLSEEEAFGKIVEPFREFMMAQVRDKDLKLFEDLARDNFKTKDQAKGEIRVLIPAFMISELRRGFEIGFLIALPFLVIDMIVSTLTMSMGMMMLPPSVIALPIKILFFILIDGWNLLIGSLVRSYS